MRISDKGNLNCVSISNSHLDGKCIRQVIRLDGLSISSVKTAYPVSNKFSVLEAKQEKPPINPSGTPSCASTDHDSATGSTSHAPTDPDTASGTLSHIPTTPDPPKPDELDDIVLVIDSNGKFIDPNKFSYNKQLHRIFCPTISSVTKILMESNLGNPRHIIVHVGTNDIEHKTLDSCQSQFQEMVRITVEQYPSANFLISSLLKRSDDKDTRRLNLNAELSPICIPFPNVHVVNNENIPEDHLFDNKHLKMSNLKDVIFNRMRQNRLQPLRISDHRRYPERHHHYGSMTSRSDAQPRFQAHPPSMPSLPTVHPTSHKHGGKPSYAAVVNMPPTVTASPTGLQLSTAVDMNTILTHGKNAMCFLSPL